MVCLNNRQKEMKLLNLLPNEEFSSIVDQGISIRLPVYEARKALAEEKINEFRKRYKRTFQQIKTIGLPKGAKEEIHEDYVEWSHWNRVYKDAEIIINQFKTIREPIGRG